MALQPKWPPNMPSLRPEPIRAPRLLSPRRVRVFIDSVLRGSGQVVFMDHPGCGGLHFVALAWGAWAGGTTLAVVVGAGVGTAVATLAAGLMRLDPQATRAGLYGFNGLLVGAALPTFLAHTPGLWALLVVACAASTAVTQGLQRGLARWQLPGLTFPFILTTWLALWAASWLGLPVLATAEGAAAPGLVEAVGPLGWVHAALVSVGQVFFVNDAAAGALFLLALAVASRRAALAAAGGAWLAVAAAQLLGAEPGAVAQGLWGYPAVLSAVAVGAVFRPRSARTLWLAAAATLLTVLVQGAVFRLAVAVGLPPLTFAFVLVTWVFLLARGGGARP